MTDLIFGISGEDYRVSFREDYPLFGYIVKDNKFGWCWEQDPNTRIMREHLLEVAAFMEVLK